MAHSFRPGPVGLEAYPVTLWAIITIGATGAPTLARGKGITSIVRNSTGNYTLNLDQPYQRLLFPEFTIMNPTTGIPQAPNVAVKADNSNNAAAPNVQFQCSAPTNSTTTTLIATDPANGETIYVEMDFSNSTVV